MTFIAPENDDSSKAANRFASVVATNPFSLLPSHGPTVDLLQQAGTMQRDILEAAFRFWLMPFRIMAPASTASEILVPISQATAEPSSSADEPVPAAISVASEGEAARSATVAPVMTLAATAAVAVIPGKATKAEKAPKAPVMPEAAPDDLERIIGIGPKLKARLNELGVRQFRQIAAWTPEEIAAINAKLGFPGRIEREGWQKQASRLTKETGKPAAKTGSKAA
jgi:predicted flap endonuclease-1-like 5' DNA nuclease